MTLFALSICEEFNAAGPAEVEEGVADGVGAAGPDLSGLKICGQVEDDIV